MSMQSLIVIDSKPAILSVNFEVLKMHLTTELAKYDVVVTADTIKGAKDLATELNATKRLIDTKRKDEVAKASEPVKQFDSNMKELVAMCEDGRQKILSQVQRFEDETRKLALQLLLAYREERWGSLGVQEEFRSALVEDLAIITAVTGKGALALSAKRSVDERVMADKARQDQVDRRLLLLENQSLKAGLASSLTRDHVNAFLFEPDDVYQAKLDRIIASEIRRQEEAEQALRKKIERENELEREREREREIAAQKQAAKQEVVEPAPVVESAPAKAAPAPAAQEAEKPTARQETVSAPAPSAATQSISSASKMVSCTVECRFEIEVDARASEELIQNKFMEKIKAAGFVSLVSVRAQKQKAAA